MDQSGDRSGLWPERYAWRCRISSGEAYKVGESVPYARVPRAFIRQTIDLGGDKQKVDAAANQFSGTQTANRLVFTIGKFAVTDIFDNNKYAHDPRGDFMNWSLIDTGTFDYAADAWGFSYGAAAEWYQGDWTVRGGIFDLSISAQRLPISTRTSQQFQWVGEIERRYELWGQPGKIAVTGFLTRGRMGTFADAIALAQATGSRPILPRYANIAAAAASVSISSNRSPGSSACSRAPAAPMATSSRMILPISIAPRRRAFAHRQAMGPARRYLSALPALSTALPSIHQQFLNDGGLGILIGDGHIAASRS